MQIKNQKMKMLLILILISFVMITALDLVPRLSGIGKTAISLYEKENKLKEEKESGEKLKNLTAENRMLKGEVKNSLAGYAENQNISSVIALLDSAAGFSETRISSIKPLNSYKKDNLLLQPVEVNIMTSYENVYNFIRFLEKAKKVVLVKELDIASKDESRDSLSVKARLEVYLNL